MRVTVHCGSTLSMEHNRRDPGRTARDGHIDPARTNLNWAQEPRDLLTAYERIFGEAVAEYNAKQTRSNRKIKNLLSAVQQSRQQHPVYEVIVQVGSIEDGLAPEEAALILAEYLTAWKERNGKHLKRVGAYLHMDEATPHLHIDYIPVAEYNRGLRLRPGLNRAFEQLMGERSQGLTKTAQISWQRREREFLRELCRQHGHAVEEDRHSGQYHMSTPAYKERRRQELIRKEQALQAQQEQLHQEKAALRAREAALRQADPAAYRRYERRLEAADRGWEVEELEADDL